MRVVRFVLISIFILLIACHSSKQRYQGYVEGDMLYLALPFSGQIQDLHVHRGAYVKKGDLLFVLDPKPQVFAVKQATALLKQGQEQWENLKKPKRTPEIKAIKAQIKQVEAQIALADIRVGRNQALFNKRVMDKDTLDAAIEHLHEMQALKMQYEANLDLALLGSRPNEIYSQRAENRALEASLQQAEWNVSQKKLYAPADGLIFDTYYSQVEFIEAAKTVLSLLTPENTWIEFFVPLAHLDDIVIGKNITYFYPGSKVPRKAKIAYISSKAEYVPPLIYSRENADKIVFRIKAAIYGNSGLIAGLPVTVLVGPSNGK
jgi:HlyD family secretion protein